MAETPEEHPQAALRDVDDQPGHEIAVPQSSLGPPGPAEWEALKEQARWIASSSLVKPAFQRKESNVMLAILQGRELQLPPLAALTNVHIIEGVPTMSAKMQMALVKRAGHYMRVTESNAERATVRFGRRGEPREDRGTFTYTLKDAETAGLLGKDNWKKNPTAMLRARAITAVTTMEFPDVLMGVTYSPDELGAIEDPETGEVTGGDVEVISVEQAWSLKHRLDDLRAVDEKFAEQARDQLRERGLVLYRPTGDGELQPRLPLSRFAEVDEIITGLEQWMPKHETSGDDDVAEGQVVGAGPPPDAGAGEVGVDADQAAGSTESAPAEPEDGIEDAELVDDTKTEAAGQSTSTAAHQPAAAEGAEAPQEGSEGDDGIQSPEGGPAAAPARPSTKSQHRRYGIAANEAGLGADQRHELVRLVTDNRVASATEADYDEVEKVIAVLKAIKKGDLAWELFDWQDGTDPEETVTVKTVDGEKLLKAIGLAPND